MRKGWLAFTLIVVFVIGSFTGCTNTPKEDMSNNSQQIHVCF